MVHLRDRHYNRPPHTPLAVVETAGYGGRFLVAAVVALGAVGGLVAAPANWPSLPPAASGAPALLDHAAVTTNGSISAAKAFTSPTMTVTPTTEFSATATATATPTVTATAASPITATATSTMTATGTATAAATSSVTVTATSTVAIPATPSREPPATQPNREPVFLPYLARWSSHEAKSPRVWGLQFQLEFLPERFTEDVIMELPRAKAAGVGSVRTNIYWDLVEPVNTTESFFDWTDADRLVGGYSDAGFDVLVTLVGYPDWATRYGCGGGLLPGMEREWRQFVHVAAERYGNPRYNVVAWEIGNEPDGTTRVDPDDWERPPGWGQGEPTTPHGGCWAEMPSEYARFLGAAAETIWPQDPSALVTYGGLAYQDWANSFDLNFINNILAAGAGPSIDFHNYHSFAHLWIVPGQPSGVQKHASFMARLKQFGEDRKPVWLTESYRATYDADPHSMELQIPYLTRDLIELLAFPELERVYWYAWADTPSDIGDGAAIGRGIIGPDRQPKPAFAVLPYTIDYTNGMPRDISVPGMRIIEFSRPRVARRTYVAWSTQGETLPFSVPVPTGWRARAWRFPVEAVMAGACCVDDEPRAEGGHAQFEVGPDSVFIGVYRPRSRPGEPGPF